jgi:anionic cell wall polymer biosynthesis LytR-Cps2A-Psr (LCP) family protein
MSSDDNNSKFYDVNNDKDSEDGDNGMSRDNENREDRNDYRDRNDKYSDSYDDKEDDRNNDEYKNDYEDEKEDMRDVEDDFFKDEDFEFKDYESTEHDDSGYRSKRIKEKRRKRRLIISTIVIMAVLVLVAIGIVFGYRFIKNRWFSGGEVAEAGGIIVPGNLELGQDISIVITGAGENLLEPEINSILYSSYDSVESNLISLCIPTSTLIEIPGFGLESINRSVEYGGMDLLKLSIENNMGINVSNYMLMDICNIVNKLDGINLELDESITITGSDGVPIELNQGTNLISGEVAVDFLKYFSGVNSDVAIENIRKQKLLLDTIFDEIMGMSQGDLAVNLTAVSDYIETDLSIDELAQMIATFSGIESDKGMVYVLSVTPVELEGSIFYVPDITEIPDILTGEAAIIEESEFTETVSLTVLNGVGTPGIASNTSEYLGGLKHSDGKSKFNVATIGDADNYNYDITQIIIKSGEPYIMSAAEDIKSLLKAGSIITQEDSTQETDIVIILGHDFDLGAIQTTDAEETTEAEEEELVVKLNILNGEGTAGLAATAQKIIEDHFKESAPATEVVETKNADNWNYEQTEIIIFTSKAGVEELAQQLQEILGVGVISKSDNNVDNVDISIILGSDFTNN